MFGYVFPDKPELKIKEFELFKAYYCGLCKAIGSSCGQMGRFALNYDSAFLGMLLSSFNSYGEDIRFERCPVSPVIKKPVIKNSAAISYAADMNIILAYYKSNDDFNDDRSIKGLMSMGIFYPAFRRAVHRNPEKGRIIKERLNELSMIEKEGCSSTDGPSSVDAASEPFAKLTGEVFSYGPLCTDPEREKILRWFGYNTGKWIYILDAYDDIEKDIKGKKFNPLLCQFCYNNEKIVDFKDRIRDNIQFTLTYTLSQVGKAYELLELKKNREIIENIIYGGMYNKTLQIIGRRSCLKNEKSL